MKMRWSRSDSPLPAAMVNAWELARAWVGLVELK